LVQEVSNETDGATENEKSVEHAHLQVVLCLFRRESTAVTHEIDEADSNATVDVQDQVVLLRGCDGLDCEGIVEQLGGGEVALDELLDELDTEIGVVARLDPVADTRDCKISASQHPKSRDHVTTHSACSLSS